MDAVALDKSSKYTILLVDDDPLVLAALRETIKREGYTVLTASNGQAGVEILKKNKVAVIISDQRMPGMTGIELLTQAQTIQPDSIRIVLTGNSDLDTVLQAINIGHASQFIVKPWEVVELKQMLMASIEKYQLIQDNQKLQELIVAQHKILSQNHDFLTKQLKLGGRIHDTLLIGKIPADVQGFVIDATTIPSAEIDGDFFEFYQPSPYVLDVVIGDVMGKGIPAALVGTAVKTQLMRFAVPFQRSQIFTKEGLWEEDLLKPQEIMTHVHKEIAKQLINLDYFVSLFYARFNLQNHVMAYVDCGSTKPLHYKHASGCVEALAGEHFPLGTVEKHEYHPVEIKYGIGDIFVFYSDGVTETKSPTEELFGFDRLVNIVKANFDADPKTLVNSIRDAVIEFAHKDHFDDDLTLIVLKAIPSNMPATLGCQAAKFSSDLSQLKHVRNFVNRACLNARGNAVFLSDQLQLAINEIFCNIVKHGYKGAQDGYIRIQSELTQDGISFYVADQGNPFDPSQVEEPSLAGDKTDGFGWHIIREIADKVVYMHKESENGWNHLHLFKKFYLKGNAMQLSHTNRDHVLIITPEGSSLDAKDASEFRENVIALIASNESSQVIFDLSNLQFIDSSGLGTLLSVLRNLHSSGGELKLANMTKPVRTMFELVSMHKIFEIYSTTDDAIRSFHNARC